MKDDMISRAEALDALGERPVVWLDNDDYTLGERNQYDIDRLAIETVPSVDAVWVVRCRNCKYWDTVSESTYATTHHQCKILNLMSIGSWYCASGERKDGEQQ